MKPFNVLLLALLAMMSIGCAAHQPRQAVAVVKVQKIEVRKALPVEIRRAIPVVRSFPTIASEPKFPVPTPVPVSLPSGDSKPAKAVSVAKKPSLAEQGLDRFHRLAVLPPIQMPEHVDGGVTVFWVTIGIAIVLAATAVKVVERRDDIEKVADSTIEEVLPELTAKTGGPPTKRKRVAKPRKPKATHEEALS